jgi:hypothetical protein
MSDITLRVNADFEKASAAFKSLADSSEETRNKIEKFSDSFQTKQVDKFIDKQNLLEVSLTGTRGGVKAMEVASNNYQKEIERLIRSGLDPQSEAIKRLSKEQEVLKLKIKETTDAEKFLEETTKNLEKASFALLAAIGAAGVALIGITNETAKAGDEFAKTSRNIGLTAEELQELDYAAKMSGVSDIRGHLEKLNTAVINVKNDTGTLTKYLENNDKQLLGQLKDVKSNSKAFDLLMQSIKNTQDPFKKSELAMAAFGKAGKDIILMAEQGADGIANLRAEAHKYGIMSNDAVKAAESYIDAQTRLKKSFEGVRNELGSSLMPIITDIMQKVADVIAGVDDWDVVFKNLIITVGAVTGALVTFVTVLKIAPVIQGVVVAIKTAGGALSALRIKILAVNAAIAANPIGLIATGIAVAAGLIIGVIGSAISKQKEYTNSFDENTNAVSRNSTALANNMMLINDAAFEGSSAFNNLNTLLNCYNEGLTRLALNQAALRQLEENGAATATINMYRQSIQDEIEWIDRYERRIRALAQLRGQVFVDGQVQDIPQPQSNTPISIPVVIEPVIDETEYAKTLQERLNDINLTEQQSRNEQINIVKAFLQQRAELESDNHLEQIAFLEQQKIELMAMYQEGSDERVAIEKGADEAILKSKQDLANAERQILETRLGAFTDFTSGIGALLEQGAEQNQGFAIMAKAIASAEAAINSYLAFTKALASVPYPYNIIAGAGVLAAGLAQQAKIISTPIPSAETGGRFIVPNSAGVDSQIMRVNPGEQVDVTPRGMTGNNESFNFNFVMDGRVFAEITNKLARSGELYTLELAGNL